MTADSLDETFEALIDATLADTFPASDPPFWTLGLEPHPHASLPANSPQARQARASMLEREDREREAQPASQSPCKPKPEA